MIWFLRMARWVRNPPNAKRVALVLGVIAAVTALYFVEQVFGWPEALTVENIWRGVRVR